MTENYALLEQAIEHHEHVTAMYDGERRAFCPHALGTKDGTKHVLGYQFEGGACMAFRRAANGAASLWIAC